MGLKSLLSKRPFKMSFDWEIIEISFFKEVRSNEYMSRTLLNGLFALVAYMVGGSHLHTPKFIS